MESKTVQDAETIRELERRLADFQAQVKAKPPAKMPASKPESRASRIELIDQHALRANAAVESSLDSLASFLVAPAQNDEEKTRALFRWVADRIAYDVEALELSPRPSQKADRILRVRKGVCEAMPTCSNSFASARGWRR